MGSPMDIPWLFQKLDSDDKGLTTQEAQERLKRFGPNELSKTKKRSIVVDSLLHSVNPLVGILLLAAIISGLTGSVISAAIIVTMVILSVVIDYVQCNRSYVAVEQLRKSVAIKVSTLRDGQWIDLFSQELVPGDVIQLSAGDLIPADALLLTEKDLHVQEAALTGESLPVEKTRLPLNRDHQC